MMQLVRIYLRNNDYYMHIMYVTQFDDTRRLILALPICSGVVPDELILIPV